MNNPQYSRRLALGLCRECDNPRHPSSKIRCWYHIVKSRARAREKLGLNPQHRSRRGRPGITKVASDLEGVA
jgi:hypothetical protein